MWFKPLANTHTGSGLIDTAGYWKLYQYSTQRVILKGMECGKDLMKLLTPTFELQNGLKEIENQSQRGWNNVRVQESNSMWTITIMYRSVQIYYSNACVVYSMHVMRLNNIFRCIPPIGQSLYVVLLTLEPEKKIFVGFVTKSIIRKIFTQSFRIFSLQMYCVCCFRL